MPGAASLTQVNPGDIVPISSWSTTFVYPPGALELQSVTLYCTAKEIASDTPVQAFSEDVNRAAIANGANQTIQVTGAPRSFSLAHCGAVSMFSQGSILQRSCCSYRGTSLGTALCMESETGCAAWANCNFWHVAVRNN